MQLPILLLSIIKGKMSSMKKALFVPIVFIFSLVLCAVGTAGIFQLYFCSGGMALMCSMQQFGNLVLCFVPLSMLIAAIMVFEFVLRKNVHLGLATLFLVPVIIAGVFGIYKIMPELQKQSTGFILNALQTFGTGRSFFLQSFFSVGKTFLADCVADAQISSTAFFIFSFAFWAAFFSYSVIAKNCSEWKLLNFVLMLAMVAGSFYLYAFLKQKAVQDFAAKTFLHHSEIRFEAFVFYAIAALLFLFFVIRSIVRWQREKKRSSI